MIGYIYIFLAVALTVYAQLIFKWRVSKFSSEFPRDFIPKIKVFLNIIFDPYIISGYLSAFCVSVIWVLILKKFQLSYAYVFLSLPFVFVSYFSYVLFGEAFNSFKILGSLLVIIGVLIVALKG